MKSAAYKQYEALTRRLLALREHPVSEDEEDDLLDLMDVVWDEMSPMEQAEMRGRAIDSFQQAARVFSMGFDADTPAMVAFAAGWQSTAAPTTFERTQRVTVGVSSPKAKRENEVLIHA